MADDRAEQMPALTRTNRMVVRLLAVMIPFEVWYTYSELGESVITSVFGGAVIVLLVFTYLRRTRSGTPVSDQLRVLAHPVVRGLYALCGLVGIAFLVDFAI